MTDETTASHPRSKGGDSRGRQLSARRVRDLIGASIADGLIDADAPLSEDDLTVLFNASRGAVRAALVDLQDAGVIQRKRRVGTRVNRVGVRMPLTDVNPIVHPDDDHDDDSKLDLVIVEDRQVPNFPLARKRLKIEDSVVSMVENLWLFSGEAIGLRTAYYPTRATYRPGTIVGPLTMKALIEDYFEKSAGESIVSFGAEVADARTARLLSVPEGSALAIREMTYLDGDGVPIQIVFDRYRADRVRFEGVVQAARNGSRG